MVKAFVVLNLLKKEATVYGHKNVGHSLSDMICGLDLPQGLVRVEDKPDRIVLSYPATWFYPVTRAFVIQSVEVPVSEYFVRWTQATDALSIVSQATSPLEVKEGESLVFEARGGGVTQVDHVIPGWVRATTLPLLTFFKREGVTEYNFEPFKSPLKE